MSKDLLKEAIADAKAVRETAIANAKLALEEAFTPKLQSMLSAKLQEDDMEDEEEVDVDAVEMAHGDEEAEEGHHEAAHDEDEAEAEEGMREEDDEDHEAEEGMREEDEEEGDDLDLEEIIKELEHEDEDEAEEGMREQSDSSDVGKGDNKMDQADNDTEDPGKAKLSEEAEEDEEIDLDEVIKSLTEEDEDEEVNEEDDKEAELEEAYNTIRSLKDTLQEVNLLNAKLLFSNKLFKGNNLSESQKMKVIETFDRAANLREVKLVYTTLAESFTGKTVKKGLTEGFASKKSNSTAPKGQIVESNGMADRMKRLAGLL